MFSATFPEDVQDAARKFLHPDYNFISIGTVGEACKSVEQIFLLVSTVYSYGK